MTQMKKYSITYFNKTIKRPLIYTGYKQLTLTFSIVSLNFALMIKDHLGKNPSVSVLHGGKTTYRNKSDNEWVFCTEPSPKVIDRLSKVFNIIKNLSTAKQQRCPTQRT